MMRLDFEKQNGLIPCIVQDVDTKKVNDIATKIVNRARLRYNNACFKEDDYGSNNL